MNIKKFRYYYPDLEDEKLNYKLYVGDKIWHEVCLNENLDVVQFIYSFNGIREEILKEEGYNPFLIACQFNPNIKVIKYIHKIFPSFIHFRTKFNSMFQNAAYLVLINSRLIRSDQLKIFRYLYLNGIDIHFLIMSTERNKTIYHSIFTNYYAYSHKDKNIIQYFYVISQDFDYHHNEHDDKGYKKPYFWKEIGNNCADEQSKRVNQWKNRFEEHVLRKLSKMIQQHMLKNRNE